jgi:predicted nucleic acid-binding protein
MTASSTPSQRSWKQRILIANVPEEFHHQRDPDDEMYINLAIVRNATYLVSRDKDLLDLMTTSTDVARRFRSRYPFLQITTAATFITAITALTRLFPVAGHVNAVIRP